MAKQYKWDCLSFCDQIFNADADENLPTLRCMKSFSTLLKVKVKGHHSLVKSHSPLWSSVFHQSLRPPLWSCSWGPGGSVELPVSPSSASVPLDQWSHPYQCHTYKTTKPHTALGQCHSRTFAGSSFLKEKIIIIYDSKWMSLWVLDYWIKEAIQRHHPR